MCGVLQWGGGADSTLALPTFLARRRVDAMASNGAPDLSTVHLYYEDTEQFTCEARLLKQEDVVSKDKSPQFALILDRTVMHPQGGEQFLLSCS